ncbi:MAG: MATE family efflux transporter, partial [Planctomycetes bacterium]|nr:MATE family efflux transporter [Planctomycetota bacterium]
MDQNDNDRSKRLGEESVWRLLLTFSVPAIVGMVVHAVYNVVDRVFIGQAVGSLGIAGTTVAFPFMLIMLAFGMLVGLGATALISIRLGEQKKEEAEGVLGNATVLLIVIALALTVAGLWFLDPLLIAFGATETVLPYARAYLRIILLGAVFQATGFGLNACIRGEGNPKIAMFTMLIGALLNIVLDAVFILGLGWGMEGAAIATVISQAVSAVWVFAYFLGGKSLLRLRMKNLRVRWSICGTILAIGSPPFAMQIAASVLNGILNQQLRTHGGDLALSAMGIVYSMIMLILMPIFGLNQGVQPIIGYNYGALRFERVKRTLQLAIVAATAIALVGFVVGMLFPVQVVRLFNRDDEALVALGSHAIRICLMMLPIIGFQIVGASYFQAVGKPKQAM